MQNSQRLDQRLHMLREEVRTMSLEKELTERLWRERLQRCQRQLKAKEEEMSRQSQYFENFKSQLHQKLSLARDREQSLQSRIYALEKQLLDMTVSAATGMTTIRAVRITPETVRHIDEQDKLPSLRGEGEGEEEKKEERRKQWQPEMREEGKAETDVDDRGNKDTKQTSNEARLQSFIISLQEDLRVLLEREEDGMTERRRLLEQLLEAQENSHFLGGKVEEMKAEGHQLRLSESSLLKEVEELKEENQRLQQILRDVAKTPSELSTKPESASESSSTSCCPSVPGNKLLHATAMGQSSSGSSGEVQPTAEKRRVQDSFETPPDVHQGAAERVQNNTEDCFSSAKSKTATKRDPINLFQYFGSKPNTHFQSLSITTGFLNEFKSGNLEQSSSEESDALREAFQSLGLGEDLREKCEHLEVALKQIQAQLEATTQENAQLKLQLRKDAEEQRRATAQRSTRDKIIPPSTIDRADLLPSFPAKDDAVLAVAQDDLVQALNQENRALAERIQELMAHIEIREEEIKKEHKQLREHIFRLEEDGDRLEQENQEQAGLISELTKKTEDDLNTIMELQQKLAESEEESQQCQVQEGECPAGKPESFLQNNQEEDSDTFAANVIKVDEEVQVTFSQETDNLTTAPSSGCQRNNQLELLQNNSQNNLHVSSLTGQVAQLTNSVQNLKTEKEELIANIDSLREQQGEVTLSVQRQTEEKQHLTRTIWGLKEQKDSIFQSLSDLRQEKEPLSRAVCGLKDERDQLLRSVSDLKETKEQLTESLSALQRDKEAITESVSSGKDERDRVMQSVRGLQMENDQLSQTVLRLEEQRNKLTDSLKHLTEEIDQKRLTHSLKEDPDQLVQSVSSLKEEKGKIEHSISCLKREEEEVMQKVLDLKEERHNLQIILEQAETELNHKQQLVDPLRSDNAGPECETSSQTDKFKQKQNELMGEIEALGAELKQIQAEVDKRLAETKRLQSELSRSEARCDEAEKEAARAAEQVIRLTGSISQMDDIRKENESLSAQIKELQNKLTVLLREKTAALSLKAQTEEQHNILTAQLKAKSVALEELNSEYTALKRGRGSRDDLSTTLVSLRARYDDIRAKYDALLKRKSQTDLDIAPLKAKLSCLVVKCQERNCLLVEMMKSLRKQSCLDPELTQRVKHLLRDAALQEYAAAFTPGSYTQTGDCSNGLTQEFFSAFQNHTDGFTPDDTCPGVSIYVSKQQNRVEPESGTQYGESKKHVPIMASETSANLDVGPAAEETLKKNSPERIPPVPEPASVQVSSVVPLKDSLVTNILQLSPASGPVRAKSRPENLGFEHLDMKQKSSSWSSSLGKTSRSPTSSSSSTRVSPSPRLSSPEKIINLHEQLQKTLTSSFQAPESRGRGQEPRRSLSLSAQADLNSPNTTSSFHPTLSLTVPTKHVPTERTKPATSQKSPTLFNAVVSRSADVKLSPSIFMKRLLKADVCTSPTTLSSSDFPLVTLTPSKDESVLTGGSKVTAQKITTVHYTSDAAHTASTPRNILESDASNTKSTPSDKTPSQLNVCNITSKTSCSQSAHSSQKTSIKSSTESSAAQEKTSRRLKPEAPAEVCSVEVIKTVGQSSLLIGWERPPLDELGCSNGTFVYGYRVLVNREFHKSVMSSACTKCILENIDLSVPVHIGVQTLGSNGLRSNSVQTVHNTSNRTEQN
ncbi:golgin subfamily B member 1 [Kryptolebias marmoratus]|uniref:golgin subfamily B member 1 n=1 Tax=Kryptolebias marmoratus TaxID=37003 RepID=UPI0007F883AC|nr:golgin subfamily B member 1 [Kryptolebias marmoratus]